ncbi:hypothetical protein BKA70DRAFT_1283456 [Coprinopsis sp. MPI-PUGE-AT-0042]|nr:hypothetical protein BKA70DRAFT_1283456 [Coprinopsis sp. MPI-PUGE-AT-0042]
MFWPLLSSSLAWGAESLPPSAFGSSLASGASSISGSVPLTGFTDTFGIADLSLPTMMMVLPAQGAPLSLGAAVFAASDLLL